MKKNSLLLVIGLCVVLAVTGSAMANPTTYTETIDIYRVLAPSGMSLFIWYHHNPAETYGGGPMTPEQYEAAVSAGNISDVTLTITVDDLNQDEEVYVAILDKDNFLHPLGMLETMTVPGSLGLIRESGANPGYRSTTTFDNIEPGWLDGLPAIIQLSGSCSSMEIETSTLGVTVAAIPAPGAILLGSIGVGLVGWLRRRGTM